MTINYGRSARIISVTSGKGGVGKTSLAVNLSVALARIGRHTLLADCDLGMANAAILLGLNPPTTIDDVLAGRLHVEDVMMEGPEGLMVLPGGSGTGSIPEFGSVAQRHLADGLRPHARTRDFIIVDTPTGASPATLDMVSAADMIVLVLSDEPTAFMDAYATVKMLTLDHGCMHFSVIANLLDSEAAGRTLFSHFNEVVKRFLPANLNYLGSVPTDRHMREAVLHKRCCVEAFPASPAAMALSRIAAQISDMSIPVSPGGQRFLGQEVGHVVR